MRYCFGIVLFGCVTGLAYAQPATDTPAAAAARKRQEAIHSLEIVFRIKEITEPGAVSAVSLPNSAAQKLLPAERLTVESINRLLIDGDRLRYENNHPIPHSMTGEMIPNRELGVRDGQIAKKYYVPVEGRSRESSYGMIQKANKTLLAKDFILLPVILACRGYNPLFCPHSFANNVWTPSPGTVITKGIKLQEYKHVKRSSTNGFSLWVDTDREQSIKKLREEIRAGPAVLLEVTEHKQLSEQWVPWSWTQTHFFKDGRVRRTFHVNAVSIRINEPLKGSEFELSFPPGIDIDDEVGGKTFLVRDDGSLQPTRYSGEDSQRIRDEAASGWMKRSVWIIASFVIALTILIVGTFGWIRRRHSNK